VLPEHDAPAGNERANTAVEAAGKGSCPLVGVVMVAVPLIVDARAPLANRRTRVPMTNDEIAAIRSLVRAELARGAT
jgi:hypothetical protein